MLHTSFISDFKSYSKEINLVVDPITGKRITYIITAYSNHNGPDKNIEKPLLLELISNIHVYNKFNQCIMSCNHLSLTIKVYNQL